MRRWLIALLLAFGWLFATPANASPLVNEDRIQFSYTWGSVSRTFTDSLVTVTVTNDITNKIGYGGEVIDSYRITLGSQVIEVTEKHGARSYEFQILGTQTLILEGIDNGYWAGHYGPIMQIAVSPVAQHATESPTVSPSTESAETQTQSSESPVSESEATESPALPQPTPEPTSQATPLPSPEPSFTATPLPEPTPIESPLPEPATSSATLSPATESEQLQTQSPAPIPTTTRSPEPIVLVTTESAAPELPIVNEQPSPVQSSEPVIAPVTDSATISESESWFDFSTESPVAVIGQALNATIKAVGELVEVFASAGLDMSPEKRQEAQDLVVSTVIASQVAVGVRKIK